MPLDGPQSVPKLLSQTGAFTDARTLTPNPILVPYELNVPFWSDGAEKRRWIALPSGHSKRIHFSPSGEWTFPAGTVFVKHFELAGRRVETRLLVRAASGGVFGVSYKWKPDDSDAEAVTKGHRETLRIRKPQGTGEQSWYFPDSDDCNKCHLPVAGGVLGINTRQLNRDCQDCAENQLVHWSRLDLLDKAINPSAISSFSKLPDLIQPRISLESRARAYLDVNCAFCHRPGGAAADFDARYETPLAKQMLIDAPARINLGIDRARQIAPNDPWRSMVLIRLSTLEQTRMPPLGHEQIDMRAADLLRAWIASLPGPSVVAPPAITPAGAEFSRPVRVTITHPDPAAEVRYTLDGTPPGPSSPLWSRSLDLTISATVRARAFKAGHTRSIVVQDTYIIGN